MPTGLDWIGKHCAKGTNFKTLARAAGGLEAGKIIYVDLAAGSDSGEGPDWDHALASINYAYNVVTADGNDYVIVRGYVANTTAAITATLDVAQTHLIGHAGIINPYYPEKGSFYRSQAYDGPHTLIDNEFIEVAGIAFNAVQGATEGAESSSVSKGALRISSYSGATSAANKAYVHGCYFPDWNSTTTITGMTVVGAHFSVIEDCTFHSVYGNINTGIRFDGASASNPAYTVIEGCNFIGGGANAMADGIVEGSGLWQSFVVRDCDFWSTVTNAVQFSADGSRYGHAHDLTGDMTLTTIFAGGSAAATLANCYDNHKVTVARCYGRNGIMI